MEQMFEEQKGVPEEVTDEIWENQPNGNFIQQPVAARRADAMEAPTSSPASFTLKNNFAGCRKMDEARVFSFTIVSNL